MAKSWFDKTQIAAGWFDETAKPSGWFDGDNLESVTIDAKVSWLQLELPAAPAGGSALKYWNGSAWVSGTLKYWNGSAWAVGALKRWSGSAWVAA